MTHPKRLGTPTSRAELIVFERDTQIRLPGWKTVHSTYSKDGRDPCHRRRNYCACSDLSAVGAERAQMTPNGSQPGR